MFLNVYTIILCPVLFGFLSKEFEAHSLAGVIFIVPLNTGSKSGLVIASRSILNPEIS